MNTSLSACLYPLEAWQSTQRERAARKARSSARRSLSLCAHSHLVRVRIRLRLRLKARARATARARVRVRVRVTLRARDRAHHWSLTKPGPASTTHLTTPKSTWRSSAWLARVRVRVRVRFRVSKP